MSEDGPSRRDALKLAGAVALGGAGLALTQTAEAASPEVGAGAALAGRFGVELDGVLVPGVSVGDLETITDPPVVGTQPHNTLTLSRDFKPSDGTFLRWRLATVQGKVDRKSISVIFMNDAGTEAGRLNFYQTWPVKWVGPALNAKSSGHATEKIEVSWETMELKAAG